MTTPPVVAAGETASGSTPVRSVTRRLLTTELRLLTRDPLTLEALTNAARHGDGTLVTVQVDVGDGGTTVTVVSGGSPPPGVVEGAGLSGMRERAEALGGLLRAEPRPGGWRIEAVLPS